VKLYTHLCLVLRLQISASVLPLPQMPSRYSVQVNLGMPPFLYYFLLIKKRAEVKLFLC